MGFRDWLEERYGAETVRQLDFWCRKLEELGVREYSEEEFEDYIWRNYHSFRWNRSRLRYAYRRYWEWKKYGKG